MGAVEIFMTIISLLLAACGVLIVRWMNRSEQQYDDVHRHLGEIVSVRESCMKEFANSAANTESHRRIWGKLEEHSEDLRDHEVRIKVLEEKQ